MDNLDEVDHTNGDHTNGGNICTNLSSVIWNVKTLIESAFNEIYEEKLNEYTTTLTNEPHLKYHENWKEQHCDFLYPSTEDGGKLKLDDYHKNLTDDHELFAHLKEPNVETAENELKNLYIRLRLIKMAIDHIYEQKKNFANCNLDGNKCNVIRDFFEKQEKLLREILREMEISMHTTLPEVISITDIMANENLREEFDWIATREHLKILVYAKEALAILHRNMAPC